MQLKIERRSGCRACGATDLRCFLALPGYPLADNQVQDLSGGREVLRERADGARHREIGGVECEPEAEEGEKGFHGIEFVVPASAGD